MRTASISKAREFSLDGVRRNSLLQTNDMEVELLCFEAGQRDDEQLRSSTSLYQVLEGEALVYQGDERERVGKGKLLAVPTGEPHVIENAGGGLLVVLVTRRR